MAENAENATEKQDNKNLLSLLPKFQLNLPFFTQPAKKAETVVDKENAKTTIVIVGDNETENGSVKPNLATFPEATRPIIPPPIEYEAEEPAGRTSNPVVLWQVYALGGFLVLRWIWARWQERKVRAGKKEPSDNNESNNESAAADDDDYHSA